MTEVASSGRKVARVTEAAFVALHGMIPAKGIVSSGQADLVL